MNGRRGGSHLRRIAIVVVIVGLLLWLGGVFRTGVIDGDAIEPDQRPAAGAVTDAVSVVEMSLDERFEGSVVSARVTLLAPRVAGPIRTLLPRIGDRVVAGRAWGTLDPTRLAASLAVADAAKTAADRSLEAAQTRLVLAREGREAAAAELELAKLQNARIEELVGSGSVVAAERDVSRARLRQAQAAAATAVTAIELASRQVSEAEAQVTIRAREADLARLEHGWAELRSDVGGVVIRRLLEPGSTAQPGGPILEVYDPDALRLDVPVRETLAGRIARDAEYAVSIPAVGRTVAARIVEVVPAAEEGSRTIRLRLGLPSVPGLLPGMSGSVVFPAGERSVVTVDARAVVRVGQLTFVDVVEGDRLQRRYVRIGEGVAGDRVEVLDGVTAGEQVALSPEPDDGD